VGIGELSPSKFTYETLKISRFDQIFRISSPLVQIKTPIQDLLAAVLVFKLHIFSRDSSVAFDSYQSEKVRNTRFVNLAVTTMWMHFP